jgi:hypothetical protein
MNLKVNKLKHYVLLAPLMAACVFPLHALCIYKGQLNAKTTLRQEFEGARWVVRAKVADQQTHWVNDQDSYEDSWTIYQLKIDAVFKGTPPPDLRLFTFQNSGGFYLDVAPNEYLLFFNPVEKTSEYPDEAKGAFEVNYPAASRGCGRT